MPLVAETLRPPDSIRYADEVHRRLRSAWLRGPGVPATACLKFHSWIGGDRDGNPNVTTEVTRTALQQSRAMILGEYKAALLEIVRHLCVSDKLAPLPGRAQLGRLFENLPLFRLIVDEVEKSLVLARMDIAEDYAALVSGRAGAEAVFGRIAAEHRRSEAAVGMLTGQALGARFPNFTAQIGRNETALRAAHKAQIALLHRVRAGPERAERIRLMQTMNCISAGLGWTG